MSPLILVVDDEFTIREVITSILTDEGYRVMTAGDGLSALDALAANSFDLVISDVMMPHLDGVGLAWAMHDQLSLRTIPVILISALQSAASREAPHVAFIGKPFDMQELLATVDHALSA